jgi:hypothetical protein
MYQSFFLSNLLYFQSEHTEYTNAEGTSKKHYLFQIFLLLL